MCFATETRERLPGTVRDDLHDAGKHPGSPWSLNDAVRAEIGRQRTDPFLFWGRSRKSAVVTTAH